MLNEIDLVTKNRETIYQETGTWVMPLTVINENPSDRAMQLVLSTNRNLEAYGRTMSGEKPVRWKRSRRLPCCILISLIR